MQGNETFTSPFSTGEVIGLTTFTVLIMVLSIPANVLVLFAYLTSSSARRKPSNYLLANITLSELMTVVVVVPFQLAAHIIKPSLTRDHGAFCTFVGLVGYPFYIAAVATMVCISVDRFYAIYSPLNYKTKMSGRRIAAMIAYTWIHATIFVFVFGFVVGVGHGEDSVECGVMWGELHIVVSTLTALTHIVLPFVLLAVLNLNLIRALRRQNRSMDNHIEQQLSAVLDRNRVRKAKARQAQERKVACMVTWIIGTYLICWMPFLVTRMLYVTTVRALPLVDVTATSVIHVSLVIHPVLNLTFRKELRFTVEKLFKRGNRVSPMALQVGSGTFLSAFEGDASTIVVGTVPVDT